MKYIPQIEPWLGDEELVEVGGGTTAEEVGRTGDVDPAVTFDAVVVEVLVQLLGEDAARPERTHVQGVVVPVGPRTATSGEISVTQSSVSLFWVA